MEGCDDLGVDLAAQRGNCIIGTLIKRFREFAIQVSNCFPNLPLSCGFCFLDTALDHAGQG